MQVVSLSLSRSLSADESLSEFHRKFLLIRVSQPENSTGESLRISEFEAVPETSLLKMILNLKSRIVKTLKS